MNTVTLSLEDYNELRDRSMQLSQIQAKSDIIFIVRPKCYGQPYYSTIKPSKLILEMKDRVNELETMNKNLAKEKDRYFERIGEYVKQISELEHKAKPKPFWQKLF